MKTIKKGKKNQYWNESDMFTYYILLCEDILSESNERVFWNNVMLIVDKIYYTYDSIRARYDNADACDVEDAKSVILEQIYKSLFKNNTYDETKGTLFSFISSIAKNWYIYYSYNLYKRTKDTQSLDVMDEYDMIGDEDNDCYSGVPNAFKSMAEVDKNTFIDTIKPLFAAESEPEFTIIMMFFEFITEEDCDINRDHIRDVYNMIRFNNVTINSKKAEKDRYEIFMGYFIPYLKEELPRDFIKQHKLYYNSDYFDIISDALDMIKNELNKLNIIRE